MERRPSEELRIVPKVIYEPGVNETTPYIVKVDPSIYAQLLKEEFGMSDAQVRSVEAIISAERRAGVLGQATFRFDVRRLRLVYTTEIFMGNHRSSQGSPQYGWFFNRAANWKQTRQEITKTIIHESQHNRDHMKIVQYLQQPIPDLADTAIWTIIGSVLRHRENHKTSMAALGIAGLFLARLVYNTSIPDPEIHAILSHIEERAYNKEAQTIDSGRWTNLVEFGPNRNYRNSK